MDDKLTLCVEEANTKLIKIINDSIMFGYSKPYAKELVNELINKTTEELKNLEASEYLINQTEIALKSRFMREWLRVMAILENISKNDKLGVIAQAIAQMNSNVKLDLRANGGITINFVDNDVLGVGKAHVHNLRDFITDSGNNLGGTSRFINYKRELSESLMNVKDQLANGSLSYVDSLGRTKSIRNMAEIETRYKMISEDMQRNGVNLNDLVIASSHADASERCSWWQGKIFLVDLDVSSRPFGEYNGKPNQTILGYVDGKPYYSLLEACNNGFLSYNCQHRLIKYFKGARPPRYDMLQVKKARDLTIRQRAMEDIIRKWKRRQIVADSKEERQYAIDKSKEWQDKYRTFSQNHNLPIYEWRTRITEYER